MKASELIEELKHKIDEYGDLNVASIFSEGSLISIEHLSIFKDYLFEFDEDKFDANPVGFSYSPKPHKERIIILV